MKYEFKDWNGWNTFVHGKTTIVANRDGTVSHIITNRGRHVSWRDAGSWLSKHENIHGEFKDWLVQRQDAGSEWKHTTPHHRFECDGGCLAVLVNGTTVIKVWCGSDGNHPVYVIDKEPPPFFENVGVYIESPCTIEPLDYDCGGGRPLGKYDAGRVAFYRHGSAIAIVCNRLGN